MKKHVCINCRWIHLERNDEKNTQAECRFNPPSAYPVQTQNPISRRVVQATISIFPPVSPDHWCGQFNEKFILAQDR